MPSKLEYYVKSVPENRIKCRTLNCPTCVHIVYKLEFKFDEQNVDTAVGNALTQAGAQPFYGEAPSSALEDVLQKALEAKEKK